MHEQKFTLEHLVLVKVLWLRKNKRINSDKVFRVTIHPEYTYSDFIGQLLPETDTMRKCNVCF